jgi:CDP-glucose 4,6-dehydratase
MEINPSFWHGKRVLLTGHTGFKGSWLCIWLNKMGAVVTGLSLKEPVSNPNLFSVLNIYDLVSEVRGDISDYQTCFDAVKKTKPDIVIHMAAQPLVRESYSNPLKTYNTNILGTANILEAIRNCESVKTIVAITTDKCYENIEKDYAYVETDSLGGFDPYSSSKACAEHVASAYYRSFFKQKNIGLATARAGNVIGGGDWSVDRLIPDMIKSWSKNKKLVIRYPLATRPWQHVLEPLSGYIALAECLWGNPVEFSGGWNFGPDQNSVKTVKDTVDLAMQVWGNSAEWGTSSENYLHEANLLQLNSDKANALLGWRPTFNFDEAVNKTISWYKKYYSENQEIMNFSMGQINDYESRNINV